MPNDHKKKNYWPLIYGILLTAYAVFTLLHTFVLPRDVVVVADMASDDTEGNVIENAGVASDEDGSNGTVGDNDTVGEEDNSQHDNTVGDDTDEANSLQGEELDDGNTTDNTGTSEQDGTDNSSVSGTDSDLANTTIESEPVITDTSYLDDHISITITTMVEYDTQIYVADVVLSDASYLKTGLAGGSFGRNIKDTTSNIAEECDAILAINGDYYGFRDRGYVMRNGFLYRSSVQDDETSEDLVIYEDGSMEIVTESRTDAQTLVDRGAVQIFSFGPGLVEDGNLAVNEGSEVDQSMQSNPRTAIGEIEPLHYILLVSDGRTDESAGLTLLELAQVMQDLGCQTAYNLDGGGSSTMWFMGEVINHPVSGKRHSSERSISDIVYIGE